MPHVARGTPSSLTRLLVRLALLGSQRLQAFFFSISFSWNSEIPRIYALQKPQTSFDRDRGTRNAFLVSWKSAETTLTGTNRVEMVQQGSAMLPFGFAAFNSILHRFTTLVQMRALWNAYCHPFLSASQSLVENAVTLTHTTPNVQMRL